MVTSNLVRYTREVAEVWRPRGLGGALRALDAAPGLLNSTCCRSLNTWRSRVLITGSMVPITGFQVYLQGSYNLTDPDYGP